MRKPSSTRLAERQRLNLNEKTTNKAVSERTGDRENAPFLRKLPSLPESAMKKTLVKTHHGNFSRNSF